jgi:hypothetical protein
MTRRTPAPSQARSRSESPEGEPARRPLWRDPVAYAELFALANLAFLGVDIALAHAVNQFRHPGEWLPLYYSAGATVVLLLSQLLCGYRPGPDWSVGLGCPRPIRRRLAGWLGALVGWSAIFLGVMGLIFHLKSQFFELQTLKSLVYAAPFAAPLAYTGIGLLILLNRMVDARSPEWGWWVVVLAMFGFAGNFVLCLTDHAQNGFFHVTEWIGVIAAAYTMAALVAVMVEPESKPVRWFAGAVLGAAGAVGLLGAALHLMGNLQVDSVGEVYRLIASGAWREPLASGSVPGAFLYGAPSFAPLLFTNLAVLAAIGLVSMPHVPAPVADRPAGFAHEPSLRG